MKSIVQGQLLGVTSINVDGSVYSSIFVGQDAEEGSTTSKGIEVMKVSCDAEVFHSLPSKGYPLACEFEFNFKKVAGGKMGQHCVKATVSKHVVKAA